MRMLAKMGIPMYVPCRYDLKKNKITIYDGVAELLPFTQITGENLCLLLLSILVRGLSDQIVWPRI